MSTDNPYRSSSEVDDASNEPSNEQVPDSRAAYNVVSDTVAGLNVRKSDNKFQALFTFVATLIGAAIMAILTAVYRDWGLPWYAGALIGAFAGLVVGIFTSGIFLMFYRGVRHLQGKHD